MLVGQPSGKIDGITINLDILIKSGVVLTNPGVSTYFSNSFFNFLLY